CALSTYPSVSFARGSPVSFNGVEEGEVRSVGRSIGLDVHRDFCEVAICEDGTSGATRLRHHRPPASRHAPRAAPAAAPRSIGSINPRPGFRSFAARSGGSKYGACSLTQTTRRELQERLQLPPKKPKNSGMTTTT
ncbi:MAG TPA: hypothetical protein VK631_10575, partial [Solirubrobacteraceae bacterium]|nr:hypothetical protein [Solirubrobacteraceae bacterium]